MKKTTIAALGVVAVLAAGGVAVARVDQSSFRLGDNYFVAGNDITVTEDVAGDLYIAGRTVRVEGAVGGDLMFGAMSLTVNGDVAGSVRGGAQTVNINGSVGKTVLLGATEANLNEGEAATADDVMIGATSAYVGRPVAGDLAVGADVLQLNQPVTGDATFKINGLAAEDVATIGGAVTYYSAAEGDLVQQRLDELAVGVVTYKAPAYEVDTQSATAAMRLFGMIVGVVGVVVLGWLLQWLAPGTMTALVDAQRKQYVLTLLMGLIFVPLVMIILFIMARSMLLLPLALAIGMALPLMIMVGLASVYRNIGDMVRRGKTKRPSASVLAGGIVVLALSLIPYLGGILTIVLLLLAMGSLVTFALNTTGLLKPVK